MTAAEFNAKYPVGTPCRVRLTKWDPWIETSTRSEAWTLGYGEAVVAVTHKTGGQSIEPEWFEIAPRGREAQP
jgi:hypothetical protein